MNRHEQFEIIKRANEAIMRWAERDGIGLFRVEFVVPFVSDDLSLSTWFFYRTDKMVSEYEKSGDSGRLKEEFLNILRSLGYNEGVIAQVDFTFDSDENVQKNFEGSYFYRLR